MRAMLNRRNFTALAMALGANAPAAFANDRVTVFAAASLKTALDEVIAAWRTETGRHASASYAGTSALARQIEHGAPADLFVSADLDWMAYLEARGFIDTSSVIQLLGNGLVLIAPSGSTATTEIAPGFGIAALLGEGRLAMADVKAVPAGRYGKAALESLGVWPIVENRIAQTENVRAALKLVATGEAPLGIVYRTDALADGSVRVIGTFPETSHPPIIYPAARVAASRHPDAGSLLAFLSSARAAAIFTAAGFRILR